MPENFKKLTKTRIRHFHFISLDDSSCCCKNLVSCPWKEITELQIWMWKNYIKLKPSGQRFSSTAAIELDYQRGKTFNNEFGMKIFLEVVRMSRGQVSVKTSVRIDDNWIFYSSHSLYCCRVARERSIYVKYWSELKMRKEEK